MICKVKVKCTLVQALRLCTGRTAHRGSRGIAPFMTTALEGGEGSASRPGRSLPPGKTRYPLYTGLGGPQVRSGQVRKISPPTWIPSPDRPARSQSLYRLSYRAHFYDLYWSPNIIRMMKSGRMRWAGHVARRGEGETYVGFLLVRPKGKRPLARPSRRWDDNSKWIFSAVMRHGLD